MQYIRAMILFVPALLPGCALISDAGYAARWDRDGDGIPRPEDCDDADPASGALMTLYQDGDGDGYGAGEPVQTCTALDGFVANGTDCDDAESEVNPAAPVEACDAPDANCDGVVAECATEDCGSSRWGDVPVDTDTVYVDIAAAAVGAGTEEAPLQSIQEGVDLAGSRGGGLVVVTDGTYIENVVMDDAHEGVSLRGRCRQRVTVDGSASADRPVILVQGDGRRPAVSIEGVTILGGGRGGLWVDTGSVELVRSDVRDNVQVGLVAIDAELTLDGVGVYSTVPDADGEYGRGVNAQDGARLSVVASVIQGNAEIGVYASGVGTTVELTDTEVLETIAGGDGEDGYGIVAQSGATLSASGCSVRGNAVVGLVASDGGTLVALESSEVVDTVPGGDGVGGVGMWLSDGAELSCFGCSVEGNREVGILVADAATIAQVTDSNISRTAAGPDGLGGDGVRVQDGGALVVLGSSLSDNAGAGAVASGSGATLDLSESTIVGSAEGGVYVDDGAALVASASVLQANAGWGLLSFDAGTVVQLEDTDVLETALLDGSGGYGVVVVDGASVQASGCRIDGNLGPGVAAGDQSVVTLADTEVSDNGTPGIFVMQGGAVEGASCSVTGNAFAGAAVLGGSLSLSSSTIEGSVADPEWGGGFGVYANDSAGPSTLRVLDSTLGSAPYAAVWLDGNGLYDLERNSISGSEGVDLAGLPVHGNAVFAENGVTAFDGAVGLQLSGNLLYDAPEIGLFLHASTATLVDNIWFRNGADIRQQACDGVAELSVDDLSGVAKVELCPETNVLWASGMVFTGLELPVLEPEL